MKLWAALREAFAGWLMIVRGELGWRDRFALSGAGQATALAIFAFVTFLGVAFASISIGMPGLVGILIAMAVLALPLLALVIGFFGTRRLVGTPVPAYDVLVPGTYLLAVFILTEGILAFGGPLVMLSWAALAYLLYRLARLASPWNQVQAAGFAVLTVLLLVGMRLALYMLSTILPPAS